CESSFTNSGTGGKNNEVGSLPSIGDVIQGGVAAWHTCDIFIFMTEVFNPLDRFYEHRVDSVEIAAKVIVGDLKQFAFCIIEQVKYIGRIFISIPDDLPADTYEFALNEFL